MQTNIFNRIVNIGINKGKGHLISCPTEDSQNDYSENSIENHFYVVRQVVNAAFLILLTTMVFTNLVQAQSQSSIYGQTPSGIAPGTPAGSYLLNNVESVNLYSGRVNATVPLLKIGGRGGAGYTMMVPVDQSSWVTDFSPYSELFNDEGHLGVLDSQTERLVWGKAPILEPGFLTQRTTLEEPWNVNPDDPGGPNAWKYGMTKVVFVSADGTEHFLYDEITGGIATTWDYVNQQYWPSLLRGHIFSAKDGSGLTFISDDELQIINVFQPSSGNVLPTLENYPSGYLKTQDGTVYRFVNGHAQWIRDRNGNTITFTYQTLTNYPFARLTKITDSIGREINISYGSIIQITYQGFNSASRTIALSYNSLSNCLRPNSGYQTGPRYQIFPAYPYNGHTTSFSNANDVYNPNVLSTITLPDGRYYRFYYNPYGELARMESPAGAAIEYEYGLGATGDSNNPAYPSGQIGGIPQYRNNPNVAIYRRLKERREYANGGFTVTKKTLYSLFDTTSSKVEVEEIDPNGNNVLARSYHYFNGNPWEKLFTGAELGYPLDPLEGKEIKTEGLNVNNNAILTRTEYEWNVGCYVARSECGANSYQPLPWSPFLESTKSSILDTSTGLYKVSKKEFSYDNYNNITDTYEYDFGNGILGAKIRHSHIDYLTTNNSIDYTSTSVHLRSLPIRQWVKGYDANGQELPNYASYSEMLYDEAASLLAYSTVTGWTDPATTARGNLTTTRAWLNTNNSYIETHIQYDQLGNVRRTWDANRSALGQLQPEYATQIEYWSYNNTYAFPIQTTTPIPDPTGTKGSNTAFVSTQTFDFSSGLVVSSTDANGNTTTVEYNDVLDRLTKVIRPDGSWTSYEYGDTVGNLYLKTTSTLTASQTVSAYGYFDGLGRSVRSFSQDGTGWIASDTQYDALGRVSRVSNPYRVNALTDPVNPANLWTTSAYDSLSRVISVTTPDNAVVTTAYSGNQTTVTDQALKKRRSVVDALGRLIRVDEPKADTGELDVNGVPYQSTNYGYDVLGNLLTVNQGVQTRTFVYDSLSRLVSATNPELGTTPTNGTINYSYDSNGNLLTKTDPRNITTTYSYDALNRVVLRDYSDATPDVSYFYDGTGLSQVPSNSKGALTKVSSSVSETRYTGFDSLGRLTSNEQVTDGATYPMSYTYNLAGALTSETYPSGRVVTNSFDTDGQLTNVSSKANATATSRTYANSFIYTPSGAVESMRLGNGRFESTVFNSRLQPTQIALGTSANNTSLLKLNYDYGTTDNNGNVKSQTITVSGMSYPLVQTYSYDSLNRLTSAEEKSNNITQWKQTFTFDRYGNRSFDSANTTTFPTGCPTTVCNPLFNQSNNRMSDNQGYEYDSSGNLTKDATDKRFVYDAENKQTSFGTNGSSTNGGSYFYDGDGKRVKKIVGTETTIFVYNASGQMVAEYSTTTPTNPTISYLTSDTLGSPRINTDAFGQVKARHDYMPFGEEIIGLGNRTSSNGYQDDDIRQKFTGQQRDNESGLDYFIARYYSSAHGRFTSTDPINITEERMQDPQQINLYAYARNNPMKYVDPNGEDTIETELYQYSFLIEKRGKDSKGREWVYQVRVNVEERREVRRDVTGNITHRGPLTSVTATANNTNNATNTLSNEQLKTVGNVTSAIVQEAEKQGVAKSVALAIGTRETFLGAEKREGASDTQMSDINPLQLTTDSGKQPTTDLKTNIRLSLEHYKERSSGYSLEAGLQRYGPGSNNPGGTGYGSDVAQISRNIKGQISPESSFNRTYYFYRRFAPYPSPGRTNIKRP